MSELGNAAQAGLKLSFFLPEPHECWYVLTTMPSAELTVMRPVSHPYWTRQLGVALLNTFLESVLCSFRSLPSAGSPSLPSLHGDRRTGVDTPCVVCRLVSSPVLPFLPWKASAFVP